MSLIPKPLFAAGESVWYHSAATSQIRNALVSHVCISTNGGPILYYLSSKEVRVEDELRGTFQDALYDAQRAEGAP